MKYAFLVLLWINVNENWNILITPVGSLPYRISVKYVEWFKSIDCHVGTILFMDPYRLSRARQGLVRSPQSNQKTV